MVRRNFKCEQMRVPSADLSVALLRLPDRSVLVASLYVDVGNAAALDVTVGLITKTIHSARRRGGPRMNIVVAGDFNRHDQLWGGDGVLLHR